VASGFHSSDSPRITTIEGPSTINREWAKRRVVVQANVRGRDIGSYVAEVRRKIDLQVAPPAGYYVRFGGQFEHLERAQRRLMIVVSLALGLIFGLLLMTFRSIPDAARVFVAVPLERARWVLAIIMLLLVQVAVFVVRDRVDRGRQEAQFPVSMEPRSDEAADLIVERPDGSELRVPARSGRFQLFHFWATWCPPCRAELPMLFEMARTNRRRLSVVAISTDREWRAVDRFLGRRVPPMVARDPVGASAKAFGVTNLPDSYLVGPDGRVRARFSGAQQWTSEKMDGILDRFILGS
jgi:thiol-disulfide isomerase/thioredoxin